VTDAKRRIDALIARAVHPTTPEEEARTSALIAVRQARENGLTLVDAAAHAREIASLQNTIESLLATMPEPAEYAPPPPPPTARPRRKGEPFVTLVSKYDGKCKACSERYLSGDEIAWMRERGATHYACREWFYGVAS